ncbi:MAG: sugar ABC transporter ATP-binding protein [Deinococcales bacterium]
MNIPASDKLLNLKGIQKRFPGVHALKGVDFELKKGEIHALLGENGAGKSTLIKIIAGLYQPDEGELSLEGQPLNFASPRDAQLHGIDTIHQELSLYPELSVAENIFMGHAPYKRWGPVRLLDWQTMFRRSKELLAELDVYDLDVKRKVGSFNVGNRQRIEIAKALSLDAKLLIMDEPTAALTESDVEHLFKIVRLLKERGVGIIYITHKLSEVFNLADKVTVLRDGQYIGTKAVRDTNESELISMMVGRTIDKLFPKQDSKLGEVVLEVRNLSTEPHSRNISFHLRAGEILGLAGLVGSGRSETAQAIFGTLPITTGEIFIKGQKVKIQEPRDAVRHGIAYVPEDRGSQGLIKAMNLRENVSLASLNKVSQASFINSQQEKRVAEEAIKRFSIRAYGPEQVVAKLSGGNQQKIVLGKWLEQSPQILIMDEPTRGVDVGAKSEIHRLMSQLAAEKGLAILMISSELPEILGMSDRIMVMRQGSLVAEFSRSEGSQEKIGAAMMASHLPKDSSSRLHA